MKRIWLQHEFALHYTQPERNTRQNMPHCASHMLVHSWTYEYDDAHRLMQSHRSFTLADVPWC